MVVSGVKILKQLCLQVDDWRIWKKKRISSRILKDCINLCPSQSESADDLKDGWMQTWNDLCYYRSKKIELSEEEREA